MRHLRYLLWPLASFAIAGLVMLPLAEILLNLGKSSEGNWEHLAETKLRGYILNTLLLSAGTAAGTLLLGVSTAWLVTMCRFPGRSVLRWALLLPLAIPSYLLAFAAADLLQFSGPVQTWLRETFHWTKQDYWFPEVRSLTGAIGILSLGLYPYVHLAARSAFVEQSMCALEAGRMLGVGPWKSFFRIALPLARPSIIAGLSLVVMETFAEFGAVHHCAVDTFATGIYRAWTSYYSLEAAAQLSSCLLAAVVVLLAVEAAARGRAKQHHATSRYRELQPWRLSGPQSAAALIACLFPVVFGFLLPVGSFLWMSIHNGDQRAREVLWELSFNSLSLAALAAGIAVFLSLIAAYARRRQPTTLVRTTTFISGVGYALPGSVIAIGVMGGLMRIENAALDFLEWQWEWTPDWYLSDTIIPMVFGCQTRFLAVSLGLLRASLGRIRPSIDEAARTLGASGGRILARVHVPMIRGSLFSAALLVFVDVLKELPITLILCPPDFQTLAVRVFNMADDERLAEASTCALAIIAAGLIPVIVLARLLDSSRPSNSDD